MKFFKVGGMKYFKTGLLFSLLGVTTVFSFPNIVLVFIDDMGYSDISCFGGKDVETENLDRLADEGLRFTQFYVNSPICSPSRVAMTTGQYPARWRITSYLGDRKQNERRGMAQWLDPEAPTLARELQKNGYATGHFGKWHMGGQRNVNDAPPITDYGFDESLTNFEGMGAKLLPLTITPTKLTPKKIWGGAVSLGEPVTWMQRSEITGGFVKSAIGFIDRAQEAKKPFYVNLWPDDTHDPFFPPLEKWGNDRRALYLGVLDAMDEQLGPLFDRIRNDKELRDNTLIIFCSDNGPDVNAGTSVPFKGRKTWLYEGGVRSPLIVWGPGILSRGTEGKVNQETFFSAIDLNRALYSIAGIKPNQKVTLDGEDVSRSLLGKETTSRKESIYFRRPPDRGGFAYGLKEDNPDLALRKGKWKFLINYDGSNPMLFNLDEDPSESKNLANKNPEVAERFRGELFKWNASIPTDAGVLSNAK